MTQDEKNEDLRESAGKKRPYDTSQRRIRSFVTRAGRLSAAQERAINELSGKYCLPYQKSLLDFEKIFGRNADTILEIGFGMGDTTAHIAQNMPEKNFIGVEVHTPGVGALLKLIREKELKNLRIIQRDAVEALDMIPTESLSGVHIFFPDPWHKARHHKRRLIQPPFIARLTKRIKAGGYIRCATDWQNYAEQILEVLTNEQTLENAARSMTGYAERPEYRPTTKFEKRGLRLGHGVWDLVFKKN